MGVVVVCVRIGVVGKSFITLRNDIGGTFEALGEGNTCKTAAIDVSDLNRVVLVNVQEVIGGDNALGNAVDGGIDQSVAGRVVEGERLVIAGGGGEDTVRAVRLHQRGDMQRVARVKQLGNGDGVFVGKEDFHFAEGAAGVHGDVYSTFSELVAVNLVAIQGDAAHAVVGLRGHHEGDVVAASATHREGRLVQRGMGLSVGAGNHHGGDFSLREDGDGGSIDGGDTVAGAGYRVGGGRGRLHGDGFCGGAIAPYVGIITEGGDGDALALTDAGGNRIHTGHVGHDRVAVVHAVVHLEGIAEVDDHLRILHFRLGHGSAITGSGGLGKAAVDDRIGIAVRAFTTVSGHAAVVGVIRSECTCKIAVGDIVVLCIAADTADIETGDVAGATAVLDIGAAAVRIVGTYNTADIVVGSRRTCAAGCSHNVGVDY